MAEVITIGQARIRKAFEDQYKKPSTEASDDELLEFLEQRHDPDAVVEEHFFRDLFWLTGEL
jgi:hypothetical protein